MPISEGYKKITVAWASSVSAQRTDPDDASLTPPITIGDGWPDTFSQDAGFTPRRRVFNELYYRRDSALIDIRDHGVLPWSNDIDTLADGVRQRDGNLWRALVDNGPTHSNVTDPVAVGQTVWETIQGTISAPSALSSAPSASAVEPNELTWTWQCPLDGGARVTEFDFQWRLQGGSWSSSIMVDVPRYVLSGLTNGDTYQARVRARNSSGESPWSTTGSGIPAAHLPGQVQSVVGVGATP